MLKEPVEHLKVLEFENLTFILFHEFHCYIVELQINSLFKHCHYKTDSILSCEEVDLLLVNCLAIVLLNLSLAIPERVEAGVIGNGIVWGLLGDAWPSYRGQSYLAALEAHLKIGAVLLLAVFLKLVNELRMEIVQKQQSGALFKVDLVLHASEELYRLL